MATDAWFQYKGNSRSFCVELLRIKHESRQARWEALAADAHRVAPVFGSQIQLRGSAIVRSTRAGERERGRARFETPSASPDTGLSGQGSRRRLHQSITLRRANERRKNFANPKGEVGCQTSALVSPAVLLPELN